MKRATFLGWAAIVTMMLGTAAPAPATVITYTTPPGSTQDSLPVSVSATFTTGTDWLQIVVNNFQVNPTSVTQNLSALDFVISTGQTGVGVGGGLTSSSGTSRTVDTAGKGSSDNPFTDNGTVSTGWGLREGLSLPFGLGTGFALCLICPSGGTQVSAPTANPENTIIGGSDGSNFYSNANGSIAGNDAHNPFLFGPVTFNLTIAGLTSDSTIAGVVFSFGTTAGNDTQGCEGSCSTTTTQVPTPPSAMLIGLGVVVAGAAVARSRWRNTRRIGAPVA